MRKQKVLLNFIRLTVSQKIGFYRNIIKRMTGNTSFPTPDVALATATTSIDDLQAAYLAAKDGSRIQIAIRNDKENLVDQLFRKLANYVDRMADGNDTIIISSGFEVSSLPGSTSKSELSAKNGSLSGTVKLVAKSIDGAKSYIWQYVKDNLPVNGEGWEIAGYSTKASFEVENLDMASKYWFRVAGVTTKGTTDYSSAVMKVVE